MPNHLHDWASCVFLHNCENRVYLLKCNALTRVPTISNLETCQEKKNGSSVDVIRKADIYVWTVKEQHARASIDTHNIPFSDSTRAVFKQVITCLSSVSSFLRHCSHLATNLKHIIYQPLGLRTFRFQMGRVLSHAYVLAVTYSYP